MSPTKEIGSCMFIVTGLLLVSSCFGHKRALTDYATHGYVSTTNSPSTLGYIPPGQETVAAALLRATLMFDEEGMKYPNYGIQQNSIEKIQQDNNYDSTPQQQGSGHIQYYYQPVYPQSSIQPLYKQNIVYGTAKTEEAENGIVYGRIREKTKDDASLNNEINYNENTYGTPQYSSDSSEESRYVYVHPMDHAREEYSRAIAYHQYHPQQYQAQQYQAQQYQAQQYQAQQYQAAQQQYQAQQYNTQQYAPQQYHQQQPLVDNHLNYPIHIPSTPIYPTQPTYTTDLFRPSEELHEEPLQLLDRPQPSSTPKPQLSLDLLDKPHLSTTKQQALLTQYFNNIQAQTKNDEEEQEEEKENKEEDGEASRYKFGYRITDAVTGMEYGQAESREGEMTRGHYHVLLPDGRMQHVHYWSDDSGYHASISYDDGPRQVLS